MQFDRPEGQPDENIAWGSDIAAPLLRCFRFPYISLCPGASYRGLHDSSVSHLGLGPIRTINDLRTAIARGVAVLKSGGVCVIDVHVDPREERNAAATTTTRSA